jgi:hypothetical protein
MAAEPAARWLLTTSAVVVSTVFVGAVVGFARRALRDTHEEEGNAS